MTVSYDLTKSERASDGTFTTSTIKGSVQVGGNNVAGVPGTWAKYAHTLFTSAVIKEGDRVTDSFQNIYDVHHVNPWADGDNFQHFVCELVKVTSFTLRTLALGSTADTITGHFPYSYTNSSIYGYLSPAGKSTISTPAGYYGKYEWVFITASTVYEGDIVKDAANVEYEVRQVQPYPSGRVDFVFNWYICGCVKRDFAVHPSTSGTWHLDSSSVRTDPRYKIKALIDANYTAANVKRDNNAYNAAPATMFDGWQPPITRLFTTIGYDIVTVISEETTNVFYTDQTFGHKPYAFEETVKIKANAVNKTTITATRVLEAYKQELIRIFTAYDVITNVRDLEEARPEKIDLGYGSLYTLEVTIKYKRANDDFTPSYPTVTWGPSATPTGTYTFPNCISLKITAPSNNTRLEAAERMGNITEKFGLPDMQIDIECDLDVETAAKTWKRAQTSTKTDVAKFQVFADIQFNGQLTEAYQTMNLGYGATIPVTLEEFYTETTENKTVLHLQFFGYNSTSATAYKTWWGFS